MGKLKGVNSKTKPKPKAKRKKEKTARTYDDVAIENALEAINEGMSVSTAAKLHNIPRTTLLNKWDIFVPRRQTRGPECILGVEDEDHLSQWILSISQKGFAVTVCQLFDTVELLLKHDEEKTTLFKNKHFQRSWYNAFLGRHSELTEVLSKSFPHVDVLVTEENLRTWFHEQQIYLESKQLLDVHASRVFICDDTPCFLNPEDGFAIVKRGLMTPHSFKQNDEKECLTTLFCANADGNIAPPMVVFPYKRIPVAITANMPKKWSTGHSEGGGVTAETFYEYIANIFHPWLVRNAVVFPVILFLKANYWPLTMALSDFCRENQIELIALYPNAAHILHPLEVGFFFHLETAWLKAARKWKIENNGERISRETFAKILKSAVESLDTKKVLKNGFKKTGLHPLSANGVNYSKYFENTVESEPLPQAAPNDSDENMVESESLRQDAPNDSDQNMVESGSLRQDAPNDSDQNMVESEPLTQAATEDSAQNTVLLKLFEGKMEKELLQRFQDVEEKAEWNGETRLEGLFDFWRQIKRSVNGITDDENAVSILRHDC